LGIDAVAGWRNPTGTTVDDAIGFVVGLGFEDAVADGGGGNGIMVLDVEVTGVLSLS
jgi:hypothetical protein